MSFRFRLYSNLKLNIKFLLKFSKKKYCCVCFKKKCLLYLFVLLIFCYFSTTAQFKKKMLTILLLTQQQIYKQIYLYSKKFITCPREKILFIYFKFNFFFDSFSFRHFNVIFQEYVSYFFQCQPIINITLTKKGIFI